MEIGIDFIWVKNNLTLNHEEALALRDFGIFIDRLCPDLGYLASGHQTYLDKLLFVVFGRDLCIDSGPFLPGHRCRNFRKGTHWLIILGSNAIFAYVAWHLFEKQFVGVAEVFLNGLKSWIGNWFDTLRYLGGFMGLYLILWYI
jgi:hypothetical protein